MVLEHSYGATVLAALLAGTPVSLLGDTVLVDLVAFQAKQMSPVDDLVVSGTIQGPEPTPRQIAIGVRRRPTIARSDSDFVALLSDMLRIVEGQWEEIRADRCRIGLVVAGPYAPAAETTKLAGFARMHPTSDLFRKAVMAPGATDGHVRQRLRYLDDAVSAAANGKISVPKGELTWRLLVGLHVAAVQLEGEDAPDRTACIRHLQTITGSLQDAVALLDKLSRLADQYATSGAEVDEAMLRRDLAGQIRVAGSPRYASAWSSLAGLAERLRARTGQHLEGEDRMLEVDRRELRSRLTAALAAATDEIAGTVIVGDPDVGKSAIAIAAADQLAAEGAAVHLLSLHDLPATTFDLEQKLGGRTADILGSGPVATARLLVIDGAEAVLEGRDRILSDLAIAASTAGIRLVAVTRTDAAQAVVEAMTVDRRAPGTFLVPPFDTEQTAQVTNSFQSLARFRDDPRAAWLLARPGLVDLVLRADAAASLPDGSLSEADVFAAVWHRLVRRGEKHGPDQPSPDSRERALLALATQALTGSATTPAPDVTALPSLRSDGLLLAAGPTAAWATGDQFSTDLVRDFSLARLLIRNGFELLGTNGAPRWAVRATLLAVQARLLQATDVKVTREELQRTFDELGEAHGTRWSEMVDEAMLTLGTSPAVLTAVWPTLIANRAQGLRRILRLVAQRHMHLDAADPTVAGPVVDVCLDHVDELPGTSREIVEAFAEITAALLRGLVLRKGDVSNPTRIRVRDLTLIGHDRYDEKSIERLGLLGPDLNAAAEAALRGIADGRPHLLGSVVESVAASLSLAVHHPELLLDLAEAYYIDRPSPRRRMFARGPMDDGIRHHRNTGVGFPFAAPYFGPFLALLRSRPVEALAFVNRMLDHAARTCAQRIEGLSGEVDFKGIDVELPHFGRRKLIGGSHVWSWYRGTTVGPYPCMSALLAVESAIDNWHTAGVEIRTITYRLLEACNNLATAGLVVGFLVRHIDEVTDELDVFLTQPAIWEFEFDRVVGEGHLHAQRDDPSVHGAGNRRLSFREVATVLTGTAIINADVERLATLERVADQIVTNASDEEGHVDPVALGWASTLRASNYEQIRLGDGRVAYQPKVPRDVEAALEARNAQLHLVSEAHRLVNTYARQANDRAGDLSTLQTDIQVARQLAENPPDTSGTVFSGPAAVAATAVIAHGEGRHQLSRDDLDWATSVVVDSATSVAIGPFDYEGTWFSTGADRSAAAALPALLLPAFNEAVLGGGLSAKDLLLVVAALESSSGSLLDEVRRVIGPAFAPVWLAPCHKLIDGRCRHEVALATVEHGLRDCRLGPWESGRREPKRVTGELAQELSTVEGEDLLINRLTGAIVGLASAIISHCCVTSRARSLLDQVLAAHRRAAVSWARSGYEVRDEGQKPIVVALLDLYAAGHPQDLHGHLRSLVDDPAALWQLLRLLAEVATYDTARRPTVCALWPSLIDSVLDEIENGRDPRRAGTEMSNYRGAVAVARLVPHPQLNFGDLDPDATLTAANADWFPLREMRARIERWLPLAIGSSESLDALVSYLRTLPAIEQVEPGLAWVCRVVEGRYGQLSKHSWHLARWLEDLPADAVMDGQSFSRFRALVDGFASAGDDRFVRIQRAEEAGGR